MARATKLLISQPVRRRLSTKWPLIVLMDYLSHCESTGVQSSLDWRPRDVNVEADQLTNEIFSSFNMKNRIEVDSSTIDLPILALLVKNFKRFLEEENLGTSSNGSRMWCQISEISLGVRLR